MRVPDSLKLNKFVLCNLPSARNLFAKLGVMSVGSSSQYSGDQDSPVNGTKIDVMADMLAFDAQRQREEDLQRDKD